MSRPSRSLLVIAAAISWGSMTAHNLYELPISIVDLENTGPLAVTACLIAAYAIWPSSAWVAAGIVGWAALNLIGGGLLSVLPLPILPFEPEQSLTHYVAHLVYSVGQLPLLTLGVRALATREVVAQ